MTSVQDSFEFSRARVLPVRVFSVLSFLCMAIGRFYTDRSASGGCGCALSEALPRARMRPDSD